MRSVISIRKSAKSLCWMAVVLLGVILFVSASELIKCKAATVSFKENKLYIVKGEKITPQIVGEYNTVSWKVHNKKIAKIDKKTGEAEGLSGGITQITATVDGTKITCKLFVANVDISPALYVKKGDSVSVDIGDKAYRRYLSYGYNTYGTKIVSVSVKNNRIKIKGKKVGEADITVSVNGKEFPIHVTVGTRTQKENVDFEVVNSKYWSTLYITNNNTNAGWEGEIRYREDGVLKHCVVRLSPMEKKEVLRSENQISDYAIVEAKVSKASPIASIDQEKTFEIETSVSDAAPVFDNKYGMTYRYSCTTSFVNVSEKDAVMPSCVNFTLMDAQGEYVTDLYVYFSLSSYYLAPAEKKTLTYTISTTESGWVINDGEYVNIGTGSTPSLPSTLALTGNEKLIPVEK